MQIIRKHQQHTFMQAFKRNTKKKGFFKKAAAVLLTAVLLLTGGRFDLIAGAIADSLPPADLVYVVRELTEYRTETGKVYLKSDGTLEAVVSAYPIHFKKDASSDWEEIDQTLKAVTVDGEQMYENTNAPFRVRLPGELDPGAAVELTDGASAISIQLLDHQNSAAKKVPKKAKASKKQQKGMTGAQVAKENLNQYDSIEYSEVYSDTDIRYELDPGALKESIVLHSKPHPHASYRYRITADGMNAGLNPDGSVDFYPDSTAGTNAADTQAVFHMPAPFMYDQSGEISYDIVTALEQEADSYILTYTPSKDWLRNSARVYPVVLDPSVVVNSAIQDAYTYSAAEYLDTYLGYEQQLKVGKSAWKGDCDWFETYVKFTELPAIPFDEYTVDSALLMLTPKQSYGAWEEMTIGAFEVLEDWKNHTNGTVSERLTWNNRPQTAEYEVATAHFTRNFTGSDAEGFEIAGLVEQWYQSPETNHGVRLSMTSETTNPWDSITFHSSRSEYAPFLTVTYTEYVPVTGITITDLPQDNKIPYGYHNAVHALSVEIYPENATNKNVIWESDNPAVAYVWDGFVSPETSGTVTITARSADREEVLDSVTLTVYTIPVESISITGRPENDNLPDGESVQLAVTILPENVTDGVDFWQRNTQWSSSDPSVASVDSNGLVTAHSPGTVTITAEVHFYGVSDSFTLTVPRVPVTNIYLANSNGQETITEGSSLYICPVVWPETATNQTLIWVSDNPTVATASATNCTIYAHAPGNATITLMAESDPTVTAEIEVTVFPMTVELNRPSGDTLIKGQSWQLATNPNVRISSGNSDIVTVGENGWVTANKTGRVTLEVWWAHDPGGFMRYELVVSTAFSITGRPANDTLYTQVTYTDIGAAYSADQYYEVLWDSSDPSVAEIEYNFVRGITTITTHSPGTTYISALIPELNAYDIFELTVRQCQLDNIFLDPDSSLEDNQLYVGEKGELSAEIFPAAFADQPLQWTSTEPDILQVMPITYTRAKVVAKAPGYAIVSVAHNGIPYNNFEVTVKSPTIQIGNLPSANRLKVGQTHTLTATTDPAGMTVTWKSGNTNVATVSSAGKITAKAAGTATISATVVRGGKSYTASFTLRVEQPVTGVWIDCPLQNYSMNVGETCTLTAEVDPPNAANRSVIWSSSDTSVATVTSAGKLTALKAGTTVIKATSAANSSLWDHFTLMVQYCGGVEYQNVAKHSLQLQANGYYKCSVCGYSIKSPELQDVEVLSRNDYLQVQAIHRTRLVYLMEGKQDVSEALLRTIDDIRSRNQYKNQYDYKNGSGSYTTPYEYTMSSYDMRVSIGANYILSENCLVTTDGLAKIMISIGASLPPPYGLVISLISSGINDEIPFSDAMCMVAEKIDPLFGKALSAAITINDITSAYNESVDQIGDILITVRVTCPLFERTSRFTFSDTQKICVTSESHSDGPNPYSTLYANGWWQTQWTNTIKYHNWASTGQIYNPEYCCPLAP